AVAQPSMTRVKRACTTRDAEYLRAMIHALLIRYDRLQPGARIVLSTSGVVIASALYCLAYRYASGDPATLAEAFSWGAINLAPWVAALEIGRTLRRASQMLAVVVAAGCISLALGALYAGAVPDAFEAVRRIPAAALVLIALSAFELYRRKRAHSPPKTGEERISGAPSTVAWARAAGNYVELHGREARPQLHRSTLAALVESRADLVRVHRSYAVSLEAVDKVERTHVRMKCGTRVPIGNAYRNLDVIASFVPSSQTA
ncbi:MAG: LytTR family transcriptional regulator DNA-binding domain-containing protein, partial [Pseudomonadota bacterium]